jgi:hypothetical protein
MVMVVSSFVVELTRGYQVQARALGEGIGFASGTPWFFLVSLPVLAPRQLC